MKGGYDTKAIFSNLLKYYTLQKGKAIGGKYYKRAIISLICATIFMTQATTVYAVTCDCGCGKETCVHIADYMTDKKYTPKYGTTHQVEWDQICKCTECYVIIEHHISKEESCTWASYTDLGHLASDNHKYRLNCGLCHGTYDITLDCRGAQTGNHQTPW